MTGSLPAADQVLDLVVARVRQVLAVEGPVDPAARFDADLHADSLDLVEIIEGVERDLRERGAAVTVSDEELLALGTVGDAAALLCGRLQQVGEPGSAP